MIISEKRADGLNVVLEQKGHAKKVGCSQICRPEAGPSRGLKIQPVTVQSTNNLHLQIRRDVHSPCLLMAMGLYLA